MATGDIIRAHDVDVGQITLGVPKSLDNGGKMIPLFHKGRPLIMQTPIMDVPFGLSKFPGDKGDKVTLSISFKNQPDFQNLFKDVDGKCIDEGFKNGFAWFKKKFQSKDVVEALYTPVVRFSKDKETGEINDKYPPTLNLSIPMKDGEYKVEVYDANRKQIDLDTVNLKGSSVVAIIQCNGIWVAGGKFGCKFRVLQVQVKASSASSKINGYSFLEDERIEDS
jgi:hypothetical protein